MAGARQSADAAPRTLCQIARMRWRRASAAFGLAGLVLLGAQGCVPTERGDSRAPAERDLTDLAPGRPASERSGTATLDALNKILSSARLSAFDRSIYLSIRAFQLSRLGREADSEKDLAEMGKVLPEGWNLVLSGTLPGLAGGGDRAAALRLLDSALLLKPGDAWLMIGQAQVYMQIADFNRAAVLLDEAVAAGGPGAERRMALFYRGQARFNLGRYAEAAEDFDATLDGRSGASRLYPLLWRQAAEGRAGRDGRPALARATAGEPLDEWPGPIAKFLLGRLGAGELEVVAETDEAARRVNAKCPVALFVGLEALRRGERQRGREQLQLAQARCPTVSEYNWAATSELKRP